MAAELAPADVVSPRRRPLAFELVFVVLVWRQLGHIAHAEAEPDERG